MKTIIRRSAAIVLAFAVIAAWGATARAHPHILIEARVEMVFNDAGEIAAVRHAWTFDEIFSTFAKQGITTKVSGHYTREELAPLTAANIDSLAGTDFFTRVEGWPSAFNAPQDAWMAHNDESGRLTLHLTLPLRQSVPPGASGVTVLLSDPDYFVAFTLVDDDPVQLVNAPPGCRSNIARPRELDSATAAEFSQISPALRQLPPELSSVARSLENRLVVNCR